MSHLLGSSRSEGELEDTWFTDVSNLLTSHLGTSCPTGDHIKRTNVHFGVYPLEKKSQRYVRLLYQLYLNIH
jgi:hypothetical protein